MNLKHERPDYVKNFEKEKNTEIKYISGRWYLYNRISVWDPIDKRRTKKSGSIIGRITPEGLVQSNHRKRTPEEQGISAASDEQEVTGSDPAEHLTTDTAEDRKAVAALAEAERHAAQLSTIEAQCTADGLAGLEVSSEAPGYEVQNKDAVVSDVVEAGVIVYLIKRTERIRLILRTVFPESWVYIYIMAMLRATHVCPLRELQREFHHSILHYMYPKASLCKQYVSDTIYTLGSQRNKVIEFMQLEMDKSQQYLIMDGHRMLTSGSDMPLKAQGFDTKARHHDQLNVLCVFSTNCDGTIGSPSFYKQFAGYTIDSVGIKTLLTELKVTEGQIAIGDKGTGSKDRFKQMSEMGLRYIVPLKRNNTEIKGLNLGLASSYPGRFMYKDKLIKYIALDKGDYRVIVYLDQFRRAAEAATEGRKFEKASNKELEDAMKSVNSINKDIAKREKEKVKIEKDIEKYEKRHQKAVEEMDLADIKLQTKQAAVDATQLRLESAKQKLDDRIAGNAKPEKISEAQHSVDFQESSLSKRKLEATHAAYVLMTKKNSESDALAEVNKLKDKLQKINQDIDNLKNDIAILERYRDTCQGVVDHGLPMYIKDGEYILADADEDDILAGGEDLFGTLTLRTTVIDMTSEKIYRLYKMRQSIEQYFKTYDNTLCDDVSYLSNQFSEEGWLFLNHISSLMAFDTMRHIHELEEDDDLSVRGWYNTLRGVEAIHMRDGTWQFDHVLDDTVDLCRKFGFDPTDIASLGVT